MTKRSYVANGANVKQRDTLVIGGTWAGADSITLKIDNVDVVVTFGTLTTNAQIAQTIYEAFNGATFTDTTASVLPQAGAQSIGQFAEIECTISSTTLTFLSRTAGNSFTLSRTLSSASGTATLTNGVVAATGETFFSQQDNWSGNTVPVDGDDIVFDQPGESCQDGLEPAIQPGTLEHWMSFTGWIGRPQRNTRNASLPYSDYRTTSLTFDDNGGATGIYRLGLGNGQGAEGIRLNFGVGLSKVTVYKSRAARDGVPNILLRGTNTDNELTNLNGSVGVAYYPGETAALLTLTNGQGEQGSNAETFCGPDATLSSCTINLLSGKITTNSAIDTINIFNESPGEFHHMRGNIAELNQYGGRLYLYVALTITNAYINGYLDCSQTAGVITFTNCEFGPNAVVYAPAGNIAFSNPYTQGEYSDKRKLNLGPNRTFDVA